jgi:hypothetical protein
VNEEGEICRRGNSKGMGDERKYLHAGVIRNKSAVARTGGDLWIMVAMVEDNEGLNGSL